MVKHWRDLLVRNSDDVVGRFVDLWNFNSEKFPQPRIDARLVHEKLSLCPRREGIGIVPDDVLLTTEDTTLSYLGGRPALPDQLQWPKAVYPDGSERSMVFLGQIACDELAAVMKTAELPARGYIYLFVAWDPEWGLVDPPCCIVHSEQPPGREPRAVPDDILTPRAFNHEQGISSYEFLARPGDEDIRCFPRRRVRFARFDSLFRGDFGFADLGSAEDADSFKMFWEEFALDFEIAQMKPVLGIESWELSAMELGKACNYVHQLLGFSRKFPTDENGYQVRSVRTEAGYVRQTSDQILLMQLESDLQMDWDWHDYLQFWISREALLARNFRDVVVYQMS